MSEHVPDPRSSQRPSERLVRGSQAARSLSDVLWDELQEQPLEPGRVAELSERLAQVANALGSLAEAPETMPAQSLSPGQPATPTPRTARVVHVASPRAAAAGSEEPREHDQPPSSVPSPHRTPAPAADQPAGAPAGGAESSRHAGRDPASAPVSAVLVDELAENEPLGSSSTQPSAADSPAPSADVQPTGAPRGPAGASQGHLYEQRLSSEADSGGERARSDGWGTGRARSADARFGGGPIEDAGIEIRDERREAPTRVGSDSAHPRAPWMASIMRRLERYEHDRLPFAVLLVELAGIERLRHAELPGEVARLTGLVEAALAEGLRPADSLTRETPGRYWLLAPETDTPGAKALAARLAGRVRQANHRGAPLQLAVGIAVCPDDGLQASALAAQADIALFAAQASGRAVGRPDEGV